MIFQRVSATRILLSLYNSEREKNYFIKSAIAVGHAFYFLQTSGSSTLALPGALICCIIQPFSYTKNVVWTSPICGCMSSWSILFYIIKKLDWGEELTFLGCVSQMNIYFLLAHFAWKLALKWVLNWLFKERKYISCHIMFPKTHKFWRKLPLDNLKFKFQNGPQLKT